MSAPPTPSPSPVPSPALDDNAVGLSDPKLSEGRRRMLDLVNRLHSTGVQSDMDLPQIAVIGSQSAGKSSLIESISGITLPRAAGTCTRCPTECKLSYSNDMWKCLVFLRFTTGVKGQLLPQVLNVRFGDVIVDKAKVEERIRRAQRAILNPSTPYTNFLNDKDEDPEERELTFSTNCVSLQISGKDVADLSFCDLPGLIADAGNGGKKGDINLIKHLVTSYISKPSCLILSTVACETDYENQGAHGLARAYDPDGIRTIGVLTKPDRIPSGEEDRWLRFIRNEREPLLNGWYCVKQPGSDALTRGITWAEARAKENEFFSTTSPWSSLEAHFQNCLRTSNLTEKLSTVLSEFISKRLPEIHEELQMLICKAEADMRNLPKPPSDDPFGEVLHLMGNFTTDLSRIVEGTPEANGLLQSIRPAQLKFQLAIKATKPKFLPYEKKSGQKSLPEPGFLSSEGDHEEGESSIDGNDIIFIDEVFERAQKARARELPDNYPFVVQALYITAITDQWLSPALDLFDEVNRILEEQVRKSVTRHFQHFGRGRLEQMVQLVVSEHLKKCADNTRDRVKWLADIERRPFTMNTHYYSDYKDKFLSHYRAYRRKTGHGSLMQTLQQHKPDMFAGESPVGKVLSALPAIGISGTKAVDLARLLSPDPMEPALNIMAGVRAYFQVAYKRFSDIIPLAIDHEFVLGIGGDLRSALYEGLKLSGPDAQQICKELGQEPHNISARREALKNQLDRLAKARQELFRVRI